MEIKDLAVNHPYYCSDSNYYSNQASERFSTMSDFLDAYFESDVDMNLCFRWDVKQKEDDNENKIDEYRAEIFIMLQRKGIFRPIMVESFNQSEVDRFLEYIKKHQETLAKIWEPLKWNY